MHTVFYVNSNQLTCQYRKNLLRQKFYSTTLSKNNVGKLVAKILVVSFQKISSMTTKFDVLKFCHNSQVFVSIILYNDTTATTEHIYGTRGRETNKLAALAELQYSKQLLYYIRLEGDSKLIIQMSKITINIRDIQL